MFTYTLRRLLIAIPTVLVISLVIFMLLELAPGDPMSDVPLTIPPEVKAKMREALGLDQPSWVRYLLWLKQFMWVEPLHLLDHWFGTAYAADMQRVISWQTRSPVTELIAQRIARYAHLVGRENVIAGSDCGYGTWVGQAAVDPDVVWAKLAAMAEGARIASKQFWK